MGNGASSVGVQRSWCESDHSPPSNELRILGAVPLHLHTPVWYAQGLKLSLKGKNFTYQLHIAVGLMHVPDDTSRATCQNTVLSINNKTRDSVHCRFQFTNTTSSLNLFDCNI